MHVRACILLLLTATLGFRACMCLHPDIAHSHPEISCMFVLASRYYSQPPWALVHVRACILLSRRATLSSHACSNTTHMIYECATPQPPAHPHSRSSLASCLPSNFFSPCSLHPTPPPTQRTHHNTTWVTTLFSDVDGYLPVSLPRCPPLLLDVLSTTGARSLCSGAHSKTGMHTHTGTHAHTHTHTRTHTHTPECGASEIGRAHV